MNIYHLDKQRKGSLPIFQYWYRKTQKSPNLFNRIIYRFFSFLYKVEIPHTCKIGEGLYIGHPYCITINPNAIIGKNCNIHKGVTIGQQNRGSKKGAPIIGDCVWIGVNSTIVGG